MEESKSYPWFKMHSKGWLTGSIRAQLTPAERGVWADLLALANESRFRGVICRAKGIPYQREYLAQLLEIPIDLLNSTIDKCVQDENADDPNTRIMFDEYGCIVIANWQKYQAKPEKTQAKEQGIEKGKETKHRNEAIQQATLRAINVLNKRLKQSRYELTDDGRVLDRDTGEIKELKDGEIVEGGK